MCVHRKLHIAGHTRNLHQSHALSLTICQPMHCFSWPLKPAVVNLSSGGGYCLAHVCFAGSHQAPLYLPSTGVTAYPSLCQRCSRLLFQRKYACDVREEPQNLPPHRLLPQGLRPQQQQHGTDSMAHFKDEHTQGAYNTADIQLTRLGPKVMH